MSHEGLREVLPDAEDAIEQIAFDEHGSLPTEHLLPLYGITSEEGRQVVTFNGHTGTVAQMFADGRCPVGEMTRNAHEKGGVEAVRERLAMIEQLFDTKLSIQVADKTPEQYAAAAVNALSFSVPGIPKKKVLPRT
jgi:hypothetical protein